jgi:hypothetical protein
MGIEDLSIEFPPTSYKGHFAEDGYNAVFFNQANHCFARNLRVLNAGKVSTQGLVAQKALPHMLGVRGGLGLSNNPKPQDAWLALNPKRFRLAKRW